MENRSPARDLVQNRRQVDRVDALDDVRVCPGVQRSIDGWTIVTSREDDGLDFRPRASDLPDGLDSVPVRHAQVQQHDVGLAALGERQDLGSGTSLADDLDVVPPFQRSAQPLQNQGMVVRQQYLQRVTHGIHSPIGPS